MTLDQIFWQSEYPVYSIADMAGCSEDTIKRMLQKYMVVSYKKNHTRFVSRAELIKMFSLPFSDCLNHLNNISKKIDK